MTSAAAAEAASDGQLKNGPKRVSSGNQKVETLLAGWNHPQFIAAKSEVVSAAGQVLFVN